MKTPLYILTFCVIAVACKFSESDDNSAALPDLALQSPRVLTDFGPNHHVVGAKPGMDSPWYMNVGRSRVRPSGKTSWSFPHTGKRSYHVPERFAKMVIE